MLAKTALTGLVEAWLIFSVLRRAIENSESGIERKLSGSNVSGYQTLVFSTNAKPRRTFDPKIKSIELARV
jgi:hypothetical protein